MSCCVVFRCVSLRFVAAVGRTVLLCCVVLGWVGLGWVGLASLGLARVGLGWVGSCCVASCRVVMCCGMLCCVFFYRLKFRSSTSFCEYRSTLQARASSIHVVGPCDMLILTESALDAENIVTHCFGRYSQ